MTAQSATRGGTYCVLDLDRIDVLRGRLSIRLFGPTNENVPSVSNSPRSLVWCQPLRDRSALSSARFQ